jgi:hypothetical protein
MRYLGLILLLPTLAIMVWVYWAFPRDVPRTPARRRFDVAAIVIAAVSAVWGLNYAIDLPRGESDPIWPQVFAALAVYHTAPVILGFAWWLRGRWFSKQT